MVQLHVGYDNPTTSVNNLQGGQNVNGDLTINGDETLNGNLIVSGSTSTQSLIVTGSATAGTLTVTGTATFNGVATFNTDINVAGHIITAGGQPTIQVQPADGTPAENDLSAQTPTATITGNDTSGVITVTTSDGPTAGDLANIVFSKAYGAVPHIIISGQDGKSAASFMYPASKSQTGFDLQMDNPPQANTTYTFDYFIVQ
jgi:cytoskeletal protein CcmA (bactofilin family)